jgi:hypothetical protein
MAGRTVPLARGLPAAITDAFYPPSVWSLDPTPEQRSVGSWSECCSLIARGLLVHATVASMAVRLARDDITLIPMTDLPPLPIGFIWCATHENSRIRALVKTRSARSVRTANRAKVVRAPRSPECEPHSKC